MFSLIFMLLLLIIFFYYYYFAIWWCGQTLKIYKQPIEIRENKEYTHAIETCLVITFHWRIKVKKEYFYIYIYSEKITN